MKSDRLPARTEDGQGEIYPRRRWLTPNGKPTESQRVLRETMTAILSNPELYDARRSNSNWAWFAIRVMPDRYDRLAAYRQLSDGVHDEWVLVSEKVEIPRYVLEYLIKYCRTIEELQKVTAAFCDRMTPADIIQMDIDERLFAASRPDLSFKRLLCLLAPGPWSHEDTALVHEVLEDNPYIMFEDHHEVATLMRSGRRPLYHLHRG